MWCLFCHYLFQVSSFSVPWEVCASGWVCCVLLWTELLHVLFCFVSMSAFAFVLCVLSLVAPHLFFFWFLRKAVFRDFDLSLVILFIFNTLLSKFLLDSLKPFTLPWCAGCKCLHVLSTNTT